MLMMPITMVSWWLGKDCTSKASVFRFCCCYHETSRSFLPHPSVPSCRAQASLCCTGRSLKRMFTCGGRFRCARCQCQASFWGLQRFARYWVASECACPFGCPGGQQYADRRMWVALSFRIRNQSTAQGMKPLRIEPPACQDPSLRSFHSTMRQHGHRQSIGSLA